MSTRPAALSQSTLTAGRRHDHAGFIAAAWQKSIEAFIETGRRLIDARKELAHGEFLAMIKNDLPFGEDTAERLIKIARDPRLSNSAHGRILPPSWRTLFELTKLNDEQFDRLVAAGVIRADMHRWEIEGLASVDYTPSPATRLSSNASKNPLARPENKNTASRLNPASHDPTRATAVLSALRAVVNLGNTEMAGVVDGCQDPRKDGAAKKVGMRFAGTSAAPRDRMLGDKRRLGGRPCQGRQHQRPVRRPLPGLAAGLSLDQVRFHRADAPSLLVARRWRLPRGDPHRGDGSRAGPTSVTRPFSMT